MELQPPAHHHPGAALGEARHDDDGHSRRDQLVSEILHLSDAGADMVVVDGLHDPARHGFHIAPRHAPIGVQTLVDNDEIARFLIESIVVQSEPAADVDQ